MNLKYNPITKSLLVMIPLISVQPAIGQGSTILQDKFVTVNGSSFVSTRSWNKVSLQSKVRTYAVKVKT